MSAGTTVSHMSWADVLDLVSEAALCAGAVFAAYQLADLRRQQSVRLSQSDRQAK